MMNKKIVSVLLVLIGCAFFMSAQDDSEWYWGQPISKIEFEGLKNVRKSDLNGITSSFINQSFSVETYTDIVDRLYALEYFEDITPYAKHASTANNNVLLVFEVVERPVVYSISFAGNKKIRNGELREQIKMKTSDIYIESKVLLDERIIRNYYLQKGYTTSSVSHSIENTENGVEVTFNILEGSNTVIKEIRFSGNNLASDRTLKNKIESKEVSLFKDGAYQPSTLELDKQKIITYYRDRGYADVNIIDTDIQTELNEEKQRNEITITFIIQEGAQYTYTGLRISGNEVFSEKELFRQQKLKVGSVYNETKFQEDLSSVVNVYYENGYMANEFYPSPVKDADRHEISYDLVIREHARSHIENIIIKGNSKTKEYVIRREIPIESGDIYSRDKIVNGLRNLMNLRYFSNVLPEYQSGSEENLVDLVWTVEEQSTSSLNLGMTFSGVTEPDSLPISFFAKVENSNLFGEGKTISTSLTLSNTEQSFDFSYSQGWIGNLPISFSQTLSLSHTNSTALVNYWTPNMELSQRYYYMNYTGWSASLSSGIGRRWTPDYAILSLGTGITNSIIDNIYDESLYVPVDTGVSMYANRPGLVNSIYASFSVDNRDIAYDPTKGWFASERLTWYGLIPGVEREFFLRSDTKLEGYLKLLDIPFSDAWSLKLVLAGYTGLSCLFPTETGISESNKLYVDGMFNGRGWTEAYRSSKGQLMLSNRLELRMPVVPGIIGIDGFFDAAALKDTVQDIKNIGIEDFYFSYGPGLRFLLPQFPLHLLFAWKFRVVDGSPKFDDTPFQFVLSFNITNR
ncbi:MAG: outer membrane protein assembly factor BamA [Treponema sp.]|nr:outer membrane protein assembly factor BamA [Treponema sp.]